MKKNDIYYRYEARYLKGLDRVYNSYIKGGKTNMCKTTKKSKDSDMSTHRENTSNKKFTPTKYFATECNCEMMFLEETSIREAE